MNPILLLHLIKTRKHVLMVVVIWETVHRQPILIVSVVGIRYAVLVVVTIVYLYEGWTS